MEDATVSEVSKNSAFGTSQTIEATMTSSKETFSHLRMRMEHVGMTSNLSIVAAEMSLAVDSVSGTPLVSVHPTDASSWDEGTITWNRES
ncbi:MAG: DNRLRE domain-containing protein, partial [Candidatus Poseidoniaceae archaeon]